LAEANHDFFQYCFALAAGKNGKSRTPATAWQDVPVFRVVPILGAVENPRREPLSLGELRAAPGSPEAVLLSLFHAAVSGEETGMPKRIGQFGVKGLEGSGNTETASAGLAGRATAVDSDRNFDSGTLPDLVESAEDKRPVLYRWKVVTDLTAVDRQFAVPRLQAHASNGRLPSARGKDLVSPTDGPFANRGGNWSGGGISGGHGVLETLVGKGRVVSSERNKERGQHEAFMIIGTGCCA